MCNLLAVVGGDAVVGWRMDVWGGVVDVDPARVTKRIGVVDRQPGVTSRNPTNSRRAGRTGTDDGAVKRGGTGRR